MVAVVKRRENKQMCKSQLLPQTVGGLGLGLALTRKYVGL